MVSGTARDDPDAQVRQRHGHQQGQRRTDKTSGLAACSMLVCGPRAVTLVSFLRLFLLFSDVVLMGVPAKLTLLCAWIYYAVLRWRRFMVFDCTQ